MSLKYNRHGDAEYASYARSVRCDDKVKTEYTYIGKVIDKSEGLYYNKKLGYVIFDDETKSILPAPADMIPIDSKEEELAILDFGDTYIVDAYMRKTGLMRCIESIDCDNDDTLCTLIMHYTLTHQSTKHVKSWHEGNYTRIMYPEAKLELPEILEYMDRFGREESLK